MSNKKNSQEEKKSKLPRQQQLPGVSDSKIAAIENAALDYAELRDRRQELTSQEVDLKKKLIDLMHKKQLTEYKRNGISVRLVVEEETVKVKVREEDSEEDSPKETKVEVSAGA